MRQVSAQHGRWYAVRAVNAGDVIITRVIRPLVHALSIYLNSTKTPERQCLWPSAVPLCAALKLGFSNSCSVCTPESTGALFGLLLLLSIIVLAYALPQHCLF